MFSQRIPYRESVFISRTERFQRVSASYVFSYSVPYVTVNGIHVHTMKRYKTKWECVISTLPFEYPPGDTDIIEIAPCTFKTVNISDYPLIRLDPILHCHRTATESVFFFSKETSVSSLRAVPDSEHVLRIIDIQTEVYPYTLSPMFDENRSRRDIKAEAQWHTIVSELYDSGSISLERRIAMLMSVPSSTCSIQSWQKQNIEHTRTNLKIASTLLNWDRWLPWTRLEDYENTTMRIEAKKWFEALDNQMYSDSLLLNKLHIRDTLGSFMACVADNTIELNDGELVFSSLGRWPVKMHELREMVEVWDEMPAVVKEPKFIPNFFDYDDYDEDEPWGKKKSKKKLVSSEFDMRPANFTVEFKKWFAFLTPARKLIFAILYTDLRLVNTKYWNLGKGFVEVVHRLLSEHYEDAYGVIDHVVLEYANESDDDELQLVDEGLGETIIEETTFTPGEELMYQRGLEIGEPYVDQEGFSFAVKYAQARLIAERNVTGPTQVLENKFHVVDKVKKWEVEQRSLWAAIGISWYAEVVELSWEYRACFNEAVLNLLMQQGSLSWIMSAEADFIKVRSVRVKGVGDLISPFFMGSIPEPVIRKYWEDFLGMKFDPGGKKTLLCCLSSLRLGEPIRAWRYRRKVEISNSYVEKVDMFMRQILGGSYELAYLRIDIPKAHCELVALVNCAVALWKGGYLMNITHDGLKWSDMFLFLIIKQPHGIVQRNPTNLFFQVVLFLIREKVINIFELLVAIKEEYKVKNCCGEIDLRSHNDEEERKPP